MAPDDLRALGVPVPGTTVAAGRRSLRGSTGSPSPSTTCSHDSTRKLTGASSRPTRHSTASRSTNGSRSSSAPGTRSTLPSRSTTKARTSIEIASPNSPADQVGRPAIVRRCASGWRNGSDVILRPSSDLDSMPGVMWHVGDAWARRHDDNVTLVHYADLSMDLEATMGSLADRLDISTDTPEWDDLVRAASFDSMKSASRRARSRPPRRTQGPWRLLPSWRLRDGYRNLSPADHDAYLSRAAELAPPDLLTWLHR